MATFEEIQTQITDAMASPDTLETSMGAILDTLKADYITAQSTSETLEKANARIRDLQDTNHKLFLAQLGKPSEKSDDDNDTGIKWDSLIEDKE